MLGRSLKKNVYLPSQDRTELFQVFQWWCLVQKFLKQSQWERDVCNIAVEQNKSTQNPKEEISLFLKFRLKREKTFQHIMNFCQYNGIFILDKHVLPFHKIKSQIKTKNLEIRIFRIYIQSSSQFKSLSQFWSLKALTKWGLRG